ncbi:asparagine synthase (glutamine-hydrolyzing) [Blastococcus sp. MG754426]|uniref:asparagine synthase (glutamine-hydrolyzing) n=1 Tax=unclassified Blastococcus TaxID=2619396 RepID=UPI001EF158AF|nr:MULTISPECIES: asparagine synthase (glutamine-hydrolyzing) [unclassified Blastococcus]MCF6508364.1 asparagine synthase (glutamine-hydrolyzing) [Blastococcus sp. MG754426]MCF6510946.1 asparagine synthase (glutamine-hydrolyzing) [Blastococcus sp. MG754427]MCF6733973.1 asparagine synthase (glutamine-hydrolyzing) [Blastococcus sp. KM273129]
MCGLLAYFSTDAPRVTDDVVSDVRDALHCLRHRGPDENEVWHDDRVVYGFNRLAFIDIEHSHQPMPYADGRYRIVFNGEIYNYVELREELAAAGATFATEGDTEAIVAGYHLWGEEVVDRLRGMFAFVIWDSGTRTVFGARDPFGIKPLFTTRLADGAIAFSSEKKALLELLGGSTAAGGVDPASLQHYLTLQYVPEPATLHRGVRRIESGTRFRVVDGELSTERYFHPTFPIRPVAKDEQQELYDRIAEVLDDSVRVHMRADVTVGSFLSGGIDSTAIAALAKRYNPDLMTFTVGFERQGFSEIDVAAESAAAIGVEHITKVVTPEEFAESIPLVVWYLDDPVADPALVPLYFVAREARKHVKVVLSGEGADELFGGYNIYREPLSLAAFDKLPGGIRRALGALSTRLPDGLRGKDLLRRGSIPLEQRYYGNARIFRDDELTFLEKRDPDLSHVAVTRELYERTRAAGYDDVTAMQYVDLFTWLRGDILVKADKMTMANSLELRVPFLDPEVFRVASTIPVEQRVTRETTKFALRRALEQIVPPHVLNRRKLGFPVPTRHWLAEDLHDWARQTIEDSRTEEWLDKQQVLAMLTAHRQNQRAGSPVDHSRKLWTLLVFMVWHGIFVEQRIKPDIPETVYPVRL